MLVLFQTYPRKLLAVHCMNHCSCVESNEIACGYWELCCSSLRSVFGQLRSSICLIFLFIQSALFMDFSGIAASETSCLAEILPTKVNEACWAESVLSQMSLDEKIGQVFMLPLCPLRKEDHHGDWDVLLNKFYVGNAIVKQSDPLTQVKVLNALQLLSKIPLLIAADAEWGLAMRMTETQAFPKNEALGLIGDLDLIYEIGKEIGRQARRVGIHINLSPVADVNNNPKNQVIGSRSFGSDPAHVAACVSAMGRGLQSSGILACAKHFPGHGDTSVDSHCALPVISHSRQRLQEVEWVPFSQAIQDNVAAIMSGHLLVTAIDSKRPATVSRVCLTDILRTEMGFNGLIISDALNMEALFSLYSPEDIAVEAFIAGCDLLLYGDHVASKNDRILRKDFPRAWNALRDAVFNGRISLKRLDQSVLRILKAKERIGLPIHAQVFEEGLEKALHTEEALRLQKAAQM